MKYIRAQDTNIFSFAAVVQTAMSDRPLQNESVTVGFNVTALIASPNNDSILAAKLRVYMDALSDEHILALRAAGCNTSTITLQLYAGEVVQANVTLTRDDLRTGKWVTFNGLAGVYRQWTTRNATSSVQSLAIVALGKCSARVLGFANRTHYSPKLVAFARSSVQSIGIITREVSEAVASRVQARGTVGSSSCQLHAYEVRIKLYNKNLIAKSAIISIMLNTTGRHFGIMEQLL